MSLIPTLPIRMEPFGLACLLCTDFESTVLGGSIHEDYETIEGLKGQKEAWL